MPEIHEGEILKEIFKAADYQMGTVASLLGMTRQNLNHHLRKPVLDRHFLRDVSEKLNLQFGKSMENLLSRSLPDNIAWAKKFFAVNPLWEKYALKPKFVDRTSFQDALPELNDVEAMEFLNNLEGIPTSIAEDPSDQYLVRRRNKSQTPAPYMAPFIPVKAQAGYVKATDQQVYLDTLEQYALPPGIVPHGASWAYWEIEGNSMLPTFKEGDIILTSQVHPMDWGEGMRNFYVYVIVPHEGMPLIKRVMCRNPHEWVLISENEEEFKQQIILVEHIKQVWVYRRTIKTDAAPPKMYEIKV